MSMKVEIHQGTLPECLDDWPEHHFAAILSDPPYGLGEVKSPAALLAAWLAGQDGAQGPGMLSRAWDIVPPPRLHAELLRILKPGGLFMSYQGRASHWAAISQELAGFKMLPSFVRIHGGAMALGQSTGKAIDKAKGLDRDVVGTKLGRPGMAKNGNNQSFSHSVTCGESGILSADVTAPASPLAAAFDGHASQVKNSHEPILCARKPLDGTGADVAERHGVGGFNVQEGRIPSGPDHAAKCASVVGCKSPPPSAYAGDQKSRENSHNPGGRYPSTVLFSHLEDCGATRCADGCPVAVVGGQAGESGISAGTVGKGAESTSGDRGQRKDLGAPCGHGDSGSKIRVYYQGRASRRERHAGAEHLLWMRDADHADGWRRVDEAEFNLADESERCAGNPGLAVKAVDGGVYLAKLLLQPTIDRVEPVLLVPFCGSGSEIIAALLAGWTRIVAYEMSGQMCELARARVSWWQERIEAGHRGDALDMLRGWGTAPDVEPVVSDGQMSVFDVA